jgi:hypothetical protein
MLNEIKSEIKNIAESVTGIGNIYDRMVYAKDQAQLKELFVKNGTLNTLMFRSKTRTASGAEGNSKELYISRKWFFKLVYGYNYEHNSENSFDNLCTELCSAFNCNYTLNGKVRKHTFLDIKNKYDAEYHGVIAHFAEMEMESEEKSET